MFNLPNSNYEHHFSGILVLGVQVILSVSKSHVNKLLECISPELQYLDTSSLLLSCDFSNVYLNDSSKNLT